MIMMKGEEGETFYFIEEGQARVVISRGDGEESQQVAICLVLFCLVSRDVMLFYHLM